MKNGTITAVKGIQVGHATNRRARTGCTVVLCTTGAAAGVDVRGFAPGTRETDAIRPGRLVGQAHGVLLTGGSAFGLDAAAGVMRFLEERGAGFKTPHGVVPIVPAAVIYDLRVGDPGIRPDKAMGYRACKAATGGPVPTGRVGAGTGATVGKAPGLRSADGGIGSACARLPNGGTVGALMVVNAVGNVVDPATGEIVAGARDEKTGRLVDIGSSRRQGARRKSPRHQHHHRRSRHRCRPYVRGSQHGGEHGSRRHRPRHPPRPHATRRRHPLRPFCRQTQGGRQRRRHPGRRSGGAGHSQCSWS